ncbi:MAG TPA: hypothetical protein VFG71_12865 [Nitrospiraceae bacterium]|nr:hypothetical protein [Nitrospiraceae bacterium]
MSNDKGKLSTSDSMTESDSAGFVRSISEQNNTADLKRQEFSWYRGKVDETVVREIVRLKREHKL